MNKTKFFLFCLTLCTSACFSVPSQENPSFQENFDGEHTNFTLVPGNNTPILYDPYMSAGKGETSRIDRQGPFQCTLSAHSDLNESTSFYPRPEDLEDPQALFLRFECDINATEEQNNSRFLQTVETSYRDRADISTTISEWKNESPFLVLSFSDSHLPRKEWNIANHIVFSKQWYSSYVSAVSAFFREGDYQNPVFFLISGDGFPRNAGQSGLGLFVEFLGKLQETLPQGSQLIYSLGNHDVQKQKQFDEFLTAIDQYEQTSGKKIRILTNTPSLWNSNNTKLGNRFDTIAYINNNTAVVSYFTNVTLGGGMVGCQLNQGNFSQDPESTISEQFLSYCQDFFHDEGRKGLTDIFFGCPVHLSENMGRTMGVRPVHIQRQQNSSFNRDVACLGDRSVLNPLSEETADVFFSTLTELARQNPDPNTPLNMVIMAHDYYLRPMIFYEMMSRFVKKYQMDPSILKRLNIIICAGHHHCHYFGNRELYLMGSDENVYSIPCAFGAAGMYLRGMNVFPVKPGTKPLDPMQAQWLHMDAREYPVYDRWVSQFKGLDDNDSRPETASGEAYILPDKPRN